MRILRWPKKTGNWLCTIVIGDEYLENWKTYAHPMWFKYCEKFDLGLVIFDENIASKDHPKWKKATWQKMLIGKAFSEEITTEGNVCYLDSDILISPIAENIFVSYEDEKIGLVSQVNNLEQPLEMTLRRIAHLRNQHYDKNYPLDSALFMKPKDIFIYHGLEPKNDYACMGLIVFNIHNHSEIMSQWFNNYESNVDSLTGGGDEPLINYEMQKWGHIQWLPYPFQTLWIFEMAWKYPFLYDEEFVNKALIAKCIESSLTTCHFLHFAGSWYESSMWKQHLVFQNRESLKLIESFGDYLKTEVTGEPKGIVKPRIPRT